jgi:hypothetical protein
MPIPRLIQSRDEWKAWVEARVTVEQRSEYVDTPCWIFPHAISKKTGYTRFKVDGVRDYAHRQAYRLWHGPIPPTYEVDHLCFVRNCVNPAHLDACTHAENTGRMAKRRRTTTHCPAGHLREGNINVYGHCKICHRDRERARYHAKKAR